MSTKILCADPDTELTNHLTTYFAQHDIQILSATDGQQALSMIRNQVFDAMILELDLPKISGFEILAEIRAKKLIPVLCLTSRQDHLDCVLALELGANDYLQKPCSHIELLARTKNILRNQHHKNIVLNYKNISLDSNTRNATNAGKLLDLTNTEFNLLERLLQSPDHALSKEELTEYAIGRKYTAFDRSIDVHISHLRTKLGNPENNNAWITTVRGFGYILEDTSTPCSTLNGS